MFSATKLLVASIVLAIVTATLLLSVIGPDSSDPAPLPAASQEGATPSASSSPPAEPETSPSPIVTTSPAVAADTDELVESSIVTTYEVSPSRGTVTVAIQMLLTTGQAAWPKQRWGPIVIENAASRRRYTGAKPVSGALDVPGPGSPWQHIDVETRRIPGGRESSRFSLTYRLDAKVGGALDVPARVDPSYVFVCAPGQEVDSHKVSINVRGSNWVFSQSGSPLEVNGSALSGTEHRDPTGAFTCIEGVRENRLAKAPLIGPADREIELQAWASDPAWLPAAAYRANLALDDIWQFLGHAIPGEGKVIIREAPAPEAGGYASAHDTPGVVSLSETAGTQDVEHQMAHAWFGKNNSLELWLREGIAEWIATSVNDQACAPAEGNSGGLDLSRWQLLEPTAPSDYEAIIEAQEAAACGIISALAERMPEETFKEEVLGSLLRGETKYNGSGGPEVGTSTVIDYREWLDAIDERGLIPAAKADAAYVANLDDLDFAQNLLDEFGAFTDLSQLQRRSEARAAYHAFLDKAAPLSAPLTVRKHMDDWEFQEAIARIEQSNAVYDALAEANRLLPEADLMPIVRPQFEAASNKHELDEVTERVRRLLEGVK